jgi:hypothetical protein
MIKALRKLGIEGKFLNIIKAIYDKPTASIRVNREKLKRFPIIVKLVEAENTIVISRSWGTGEIRSC